MESAHDHVRLLNDLPGFIIGAVWPKERVLMGLRVSKRVREELLLNADEVMFSAKDHTHADPTAPVAKMLSDLNRFATGTKVIFSAHKPSSSMLAAFVQALEISACSQTTDFSLKRNLTGIDIQWSRHYRHPPISNLLIALQNCSSLQMVSLKSLYASNDDIRELKSVIESSPSLRQLHLDFLNSHIEGSETLAEALLHCRDLSHVTLENAIRSPAAPMIGLLLQTCTKMCHLNISHCGLDDEAGTMIARALMQLPNGPRSMQSLLLADNNLSRTTLRDLFSVPWPSLRALDLSQNKVGGAVAPTLASLLHNLPALRSLKLCGMGFGAEGVAGRTGLAAALGAGHCPDMELLDLGGNGLESDGAAALAEALPACRKLQELRLSANRLMTAGVAAIGAALEQCPRLMRVDLRSNMVTEEAAVTLAARMAACGRGVRVDLRWNRFAGTAWTRGLPVGHGDGSGYPGDPDKAVLRLH